MIGAKSVIAVADKVDVYQLNGKENSQVVPIAGALGSSSRRRLSQGVFATDVRSRLTKRQVQ
jgi:hypothetical protein